MELTLVAATANPNKITEIRSILGDAVDLLPRPADIPDVVEDQSTLLGNARLKAAAICVATGLGAVADDTGLEVDALGGAPGVYSARYAGEDAIAENNVAKLLRELAGVDRAERTARFRTIAIIVWPDGQEVVAEGVVEGYISDGPRGQGGFGYDPVFEPVDAAGQTFAEMGEDAKNAISHRGRAFRDLQSQLER